MARELGPDPWERVAKELRAHKEAQKQAWGDIDNATLGRYLANEVTSEERRQIERTIEQRPELRQLTDLVRDVLNEFEPATPPVPVPAVHPTATPHILSFLSGASKGLGRSKWFGTNFRQRAALVAAASLLLVLGLTLHDSGSSDGNLPLALAPIDRAEARRVAPEKQTIVFAKFAKDVPDSGGAVPPAMRLDEVERQVQALETQGRTRDALALRQQLPELMQKAHKNDESLLAANFNRMAQICQANGDLTEAESNYCKAREIAETKLGDNHPCTREAVIGLARTYQTALNSAPLGPTRISPFAAPRTASGIHIAMAPIAPPRSAPGSLGKTIIGKPVGELRKAVVPPLMRGLQQASTAADRLPYIQALTRLGPAARDAVPVLANVLNQSQDTAERQAVVQALGAMGPTADGALPVLVEASCCSCPQVCSAAVETLVRCGPRGWVALRSLNEKGDANQKQLAQMVLQRVKPQQVCVGVKDAGELFTIPAITEIQGRLQNLAVTRQLPVYIETTDDATGRSEKKRDTEVQALVSSESVYLLIHKEPARIEIRVPEALQKGRITALQQKELRQRMEQQLKGGNYDQALREAALFLSTAIK
jgi:hypothetical protein